MKTLAILFFMIVLSLQAFGEDYKAKFAELYKKNDNDQEIFNHLKKWEKALPNDAELYVAYFNLFFNKSRQSIARLDKQPGEGDNFVLKDSTGKTAGYMYRDYMYNDSLFQICQNYVDEGIKRNPKRLDLYFGKIHSLGQAGKYDKYLEVLLKTIDLSVKNDYDWLWTDNEKFDDPKNHFKGTIQSYCNELFDLNPPEYTIIISISKKMISYYPEDVEYISNIGSCYAMQLDYKKALDYFIQAYKFNPYDRVVLHNIAYSYDQLEDYSNAIKYYELVIKYGNNDDIEKAKSIIEELKQKK